MSSKFRIENFEPKEIERAQKVLDEHLKETLDFQDIIKIEKKVLGKKSFIQKLFGWFK